MGFLFDFLAGYGLIVIVSIVALAVSLFILLPKVNNENFDSPPHVFNKQINKHSEHCHPYHGCSWDGSTCELSWRDCNVYQDCVNGKCLPKKI